MYRDIKLDDKTFEEIKNDAISRIVQHCPEWTNHNASDPGITLIELFSYMTEMTQFRLNQVPEKNYLAFLDLLGIKQRLPIPATSRVKFDLSSGYEMNHESKNTILIPKNTKVATKSDDENKEIFFETNKSLYASNINIENIYSKCYDVARNKNKIFDYSKNIELEEAFFPFSNSGKTKNIVELFFCSEEFYVLENDIKLTVLFRLPTTAREFKIKDDFLTKMDWEYYDGKNWQRLKIAHDLSIALDESDADILSVTFEGNCENLQKGFIDEFQTRENYFIKASFKDIPLWLEDFSVYELSIVTNSNVEGIFADECYHNYQLIDINNSFYPFGTRPRLDETVVEDTFYIKCNQAFCEEGTSVEINFDITTLIGSIPKGYNGLQIVYEYSIAEGKWGSLKIVDTIQNFSESGKISFIVPEDLNKVVVNASEGYWIRAKIISGNYGKDEDFILDEKSGEIKNIPATLNPPIISSMNIKYSHKRKDLDDCYSLNNYQYDYIKFDKNRPVKLFKAEYEKEDALFFGFDSYLSEQILDIYFDIESIVKETSNQRFIEWEILVDDGKWERLKVEDETDGLCNSGDVRIFLPKIEKLEPYSLYMQSYNRLWIKAKVKFNTLTYYPKIKQIILNSVVVEQKETHPEEVLGYSSGLPSMEFTLKNKNLISPPTLEVDEQEYKAVERFVDYSFEDKVFIFNGVTGKIEFSDGRFGKVPSLSSKIVVSKYETTSGAKGNVSVGRISVLKESINYVDKVENIFVAKSGYNGDTIDEVKRIAPNMLNSMKRAVTIKDYENLALNYSTFIKKVKCIEKDGDVIVLVMSEGIIRDKGFINVSFLTKLETYLKELSMVGIVPKVQRVNTVNLKLKLKLKYADETNVLSRSGLELEILQKAKEFLDPFTGLLNKGYEVGRTLLKSDVVRIINNSSTWLVVSELIFEKNGKVIDDNKVKLSYNEIFDIQDVQIEELSYDF